MSKELSEIGNDIIQSVVINGDLSKLTADKKVEFYVGLCKRIGLDPATQPFKLLKLNNKEILYADKGATQQLSQIYNISHDVTKAEKVDDIYAVTVRATSGQRFTDEMGCVSVAGLKGDALANSMMKAVTKAKRRAVLALCGLGMLDESEVETIPGVKTVELKEPQAITHVEVVALDKEETNNARTQRLSVIDSLAIQAFITDKGTASKKDFVNFLAIEYGVVKASELRDEDLQPCIEKLEGKINEKNKAK